MYFILDGNEFIYSTYYLRLNLSDLIATYKICINNTVVESFVKSPNTGKIFAFAKNIFKLNIFNYVIIKFIKKKLIPEINTFNKFLINKWIWFSNVFSKTFRLKPIDRQISSVNTHFL